MHLTLTPAYGRDYKSGKAARVDFMANKDFVLQPEGRYINKEQVTPGTEVNIRFDQNRKICVVRV